MLASRSVVWFWPQALRLPSRSSVLSARKQRSINMGWYRELSVEVTKDSPLSETTGVDERKPTTRNKGMRRPDDHEANGSRPLQSQLAAGILLGIHAFVLAILLRSGAPANLVHEVFSIDGATVNPYANILTNFDEQNSRLPRSRLEQMRAPSLHAGVFNSLLHTGVEPSSYEEEEEEHEFELRTPRLLPVKAVEDKLASEDARRQRCV